MCHGLKIQACMSLLLVYVMNFAWNINELGGIGGKFVVELFFRGWELIKEQVLFGMQGHAGHAGELMSKTATNLNHFLKDK